MIYARLTALLGAFALGAAKFYNGDQGYLREAWEGFKRDFGKAYHPSEEAYRFGVFVQNLQIIDGRNAQELAAGGEECHGITQFVDLTQEEFRQRYLGSFPSMRTNEGEVADIVATDVGSYNKDWTGTYTTAVKNQGQCGSCWAFSATEQIESDAMRTLGKTYVLSPQQITSCATKAYGCNGGWTEVAYSYVKSAGGIEQNSDYPYTSPPTGQCKASSSKYVVTVNGYKTISGESNMASYVGTTGPLSVCLDASNWSSYTGGIMSVCGNQVDHCVQAVGVNSGTGGYWKVRNSWGVTWGESGYIRLAYGKNTCDITNDPTYATVSKV
jgi:C1A family cysteine protease